MERNFKCRDCGTFFTADDSKWVDCPKCGNDNIEIARKHLPWNRIVIVVVAVLAVVCATWFAVKFPVGNGAEGKAAETMAVDTVAVIEQVQSEEFEVPVQIDITPFNVKASEPKADKESRTYSVKAEALYLPDGCSTEFRIYDYGTRGLVASNKDGRFIGLPASSDEIGSYIITVYALKGKQIVDSATCDISGCVKLPDPGMDRLGTDQLQSLVDKAVAEGNVGVITGNEGVSPELTLNYEDLRGEYVSTSVSGMISALEMLDLWSGYTVVKADYDSMNRVSQITLKPIWK